MLRWQGTDTMSSWCFAVLHHLPGNELRLQILHKVRSLLPLEGASSTRSGSSSTARACWLASNPGKRSAYPQLTSTPVTTCWIGARGVRDYAMCTHFSETELEELAGLAGFEVVETFLSDGENQRLGLYQVWQ